MNEELKPLAGPYELFDLADGETREFRAIRYEMGVVRIQTAVVPAGKDVVGLRIFVTAASKPVGVNWWDVTSRTLIAQLLPYLEAPGLEVRQFSVTKLGVAPKARFMVKVS
jgi:hypothetical protein